MELDDTPATPPVSMTQATGWWALIDTDTGLTRRRVAVFTTAWFAGMDGRTLEVTPIAWVPYEDSDQLVEAGHIDGFYGLWHEDEPQCRCSTHPGALWCPDCGDPHVA